MRTVRTVRTGASGAYGAGAGAGAGAIAAAVVLLLLATWQCAGIREPREVTAGFWFEPVAHESTRLGRLSPADLAAIERVARDELAIAFQPFRVTVSDRRDARYRVSVVQELLDFRVNRKAWVAGQTYSAGRFGGSGAVSFVYFASGAPVYAPPDATRADVIEAIGRGIGRSAAHEFAHQFLAGYNEQPTEDQMSYEYHTASRPEQYFGPMHWDVAGPQLEERLGRR